MGRLKKWVGIAAISLALLGASTQALDADEAAEGVDPVVVELVAEEGSIQPGHAFWVAVKFHVENGWHIYWKNPGAIGLPTQLDWTLPEGFTLQKIDWPAPERFSQEESVGFGYSQPTIILAQIQPPSTVNADLVNLGLSASWLACKDHCIPGQQDISLRLPVAGGAPLRDHAQGELFTTARAKLPRQIEGILAAKEGEKLVFRIPKGRVASMPAFSFAKTRIWFRKRAINSKRATTPFLSLCPVKI